MEADIGRNVGDWRCRRILTLKVIGGARTRSVFRLAECHLLFEVL